MVVTFCVRRWLFAAGLVLASVATAVAQSPAPTADQNSAAATTASDTRPVRALLDAARTELEQGQAALRRSGISNDELADLRSRLDPVTERLRDQVDQLAPKLEAAKARLHQLGPKPKEGAQPEGQEVARDRAEREAGVADLDEVNRLARALLLEAEQMAAEISDRRRTAFTSALFQRSFGLASPDLWMSVARSFPRDLRALNLLVGDAADRLQYRTTPGILTALAFAFGIGIALHVVRRRLAPRIVHRDPLATAVTPPRKLLAGAGMLAVETLPAAAGSFIIYQALVLLDILPGRLIPVAAALLTGLAFVAFLRGLAEALFAPDRPAWRLIEVSDRVANSILSLGLAFGAAVAAGRVVDALNQSIAAGLPLSIAAKGVFSTAAAALLALLLVRLADDPAEQADACLGPYIPAAGPRFLGLARLIGWALVTLLLCSALGGYVAFEAFAVDQIVWVASLAGLLYLAVVACDDVLGGTLGTDAKVTTVLSANLGLRRSSLRQLAVLLAGIGRVVLIVVAALLALAPWGLESADLAANLRAAFFGFKVGDVTVSLSTIFAGLILFGALLAVTRTVQHWLTDTFLPTTELDAGLRNSIATAAGYVGFFAAAAAAFGYLGLSLEKIAIVAGALSVGIGFGLQSIVNNFVSGLILLWERPIRVGDLVVVGDGEGFVRRISVRATEIETFDRSTVIVPNSSLISGTVKNRMRSDMTGRVVLPVNVLRNQDPARAAEMLVAQAAAHPDVIANPPPRVNFKKIGDTWLEFELVCYVEDVTKQMRVQSDLNFSVFRQLVDEGILPPLGPGAMNVGGLEPVKEALEQIAGALDRSRAAPPAAAAPAGGPSDDARPIRPRRSA